MSSTQHQLIEQCATRLRGIIEALDNIHDTSPHRWSTDLDDVHSSAESLLALIKDQAPARSEASFEEWLANELEGEDGQPVPAAVCDIALARRAFNHWPKLEQPAKVGGVRFSAGVSSRLVVEAAQRLYEFESTPEQEAERIERLQAFREQCFEPLGAEFSKVLSDNLPELLSTAQAEQAEAERPEVVGSLYLGGWADQEELEDNDVELDMKVVERLQVDLASKGDGVHMPLMTVAQHERLIEARWNRAMDLMGEHVARISEKFKAERDAALAKLAELEKQEPVALANRGIHAFWVKWTEAAAGLYGPGIKLYAHPVAQAQHSVPDGWRIERSAERIVVMNLNNGAGYAAARDGESGIAESVLYLLAADLLAAAPGKEVPQAWLDVQAERKRQVEVEGWTPEHDDAHSHGQIARAAACYALAGSSAPNDGTAALLVSLAWPWDEQWWKPSTARRDMVKACALGLAEIERLDRAAATQGGPRDA
ncbi:hypothetical protein [Pseudomonas aeruginosa]|uniref:hypothetical protein n=1 Tax=Pseudomonas aeruginosa TaxID=287 RepID=UPI0021614DFD|nr:hypothetical protein [Pseudomonas aeruginosa]